jgi:uncharacterized protein YfcZ (UPF0381/DUF406 family)
MLNAFPAKLHCTDVLTITEESDCTSKSPLVFESKTLLSVNVVDSLLWVAGKQ